MTLKGRHSFTIVRYKKADKLMYTNGGHLIFDEENVCIKTMLITAVRFRRDGFRWRLLKDGAVYKTIEISDSESVVECVLLRKDYEKLLGYIDAGK